MNAAQSGTPRATAPNDRQGNASLGPKLRRAWVGYHGRLDAAMTAAGFHDRGFPDGRVLHICRDPAEMTISQIGRELGMTRQGAGKIVASLLDRRYVTVNASATSGREKIVRLTPRAVEYLAAQRKAVRAIERQLRTELGRENFEVLARLLESLGGHDQPRLREYLQKMDRAGLRSLED